MIAKGDIYDKLRNFLNQEMSLPFTMHSVHREVFIVMNSLPSGQTMTLCEFLKSISEILQKTLNPPWLSFAADCSELYVSKGHFVERSEEAWSGSELMSPQQSHASKHPRSFFWLFRAP